MANINQIKKTVYISNELFLNRHLSQWLGIYIFILNKPYIEGGFGISNVIFVGDHSW